MGGGLLRFWKKSSRGEDKRRGTRNEGFWYARLHVFFFNDHDATMLRIILKFWKIDLSRINYQHSCCDKS